MGVRVSGSASPSGAAESGIGIQWAAITRIRRYIDYGVNSISEQWLVESEGWCFGQHAEQSAQQFTRESTDGQFTRYFSICRFRFRQEESKQTVRSSGS